VGPEAILETECDVLSPCATGGVLNAETIPALRCRVIAGAANNQLGEPGDADRLAGRGIVYAPDYVVNAGGIIHLAALELLGEDQARLQERLEGIGETTREVLDLAAERGVSTGAAADAIVERRLAAGPAAGRGT
jgi:leucine dehydrogenase